MKINSLELTNFRNLHQQAIQFGEKKNFFIGNNAQGKTNLLEAIYLLCLTKSFRTNHDKEAISFSAEQYIIKGDFTLDNGNPQRIVLACSHKEGKQLSLNRKRVNRVADFIGDLPIVISSPDEYEITIGPPPERRKFFDILISQLDRRYLHYLVEYLRIVKQKSAILQQWKQEKTSNAKIIDPWNERLAEIGAQIIYRRHQFTYKLSLHLNQIYASLTQTREKLEISYQPNLKFQESDDIQKIFHDELNINLSKEIQRGVCLIGPHRDDFIFKVNDHELKKYGSRGQHKTVLIALALAEYDLIYSLKNEKPIILIDDLFSELDNEREKLILKKLTQTGQVFLTGTEIQANTANEQAAFFFVEDGKVMQQK
ncbi:DNA replication/repair protein RecF [candidate division KSB1 bacterium 4484_87]|nr:MAG: DNA replication/repair protein RecF [candidate division KSB1 bacterium 4484_87]